MYRLAWSPTLYPLAQPVGIFSVSGGTTALGVVDPDVTRPNVDQVRLLGNASPWQRGGGVQAPSFSYGVW